MTTDIFVIYHDNLNLIDDIKNDIKYFKCNNEFLNKYTNSGINIIEQLPEYQLLQPAFAEFTAFKMILDKNLIEGDWVCTLQYDHDLNKNIIDDIKLSDEIMIFNPFGIGVNAVYNQNYSIGNENCMDWILRNYNLFFNKEYKFENISEIPFPMCSAVKIKKETFNKIMNWILSYSKDLFFNLSSNISWHPRWVGMMQERMFAMAVSFEIFEGESYKKYQLEHHA